LIIFKVNIVQFSLANFIGCGGYVNGDGFITNPNWGKGLTIGGNENEHPDDCFWFIEARHDGETLLLKRDNNEPLELDVVIQQFHNPIIVSYFFK